jgi:hypothetical protein
MKREKTAIEVGQIWRDKRDHARVIRVTNLFVGQAPGGGKPAIRVEYENANGKPRKNARPVVEASFRGDYELVKP